MKGLIVGYGRAGKRHEKILGEMGVLKCLVDIDEQCVSYAERFHLDYFTLEEGLADYKPDFVVLATPPDVHLEQIEMCIEADVPVLCEKPLCGIGQLERAKALPEDAKVAVAYNYRFHPALNEAWEMPDRFNFSWNCLSVQHRDSLPVWGIILDHLSHTFDTLIWLTMGDIKLFSVSVDVNEDRAKCYVSGIEKGAGRPISIVDIVNFKPSEKIAGIVCPKGYIDIPPSKKMFESMWKNFLYSVESKNLVYYPSLGTSIRVQELLEEATELAEQT